MVERDDRMKKHEGCIGLALVRGSSQRRFEPAAAVKPEISDRTADERGQLVPRADFVSPEMIAKEIEHRDRLDSFARCVAELHRGIVSADYHLGIGTDKRVSGECLTAFYRFEQKRALTRLRQFQVDAERRQKI